MTLPPVKNLPAPPSLTKSERAFWRYYGRQLAAVQVLTRVDRDILANHCIGLAQIADIRQQQQDSAYRRLVLSITVDGAGQERVKAVTNPLDVQLRSWLQITRLSAAELGLTPVSRARVAPATQAPQTDDLEAFIQTPIRRVK